MTRPTTFDEYVGQKKAKDVIDVLVKSASKRGKSCPHVLFQGGAGLGKTTAAKIIGEMLGANTLLANGGVINSTKKLYSYLEYLEEGSVLFIDEIHRLPTYVCESLYTVMEDFRYDYIEDGYPQSEYLQPFTLLGATTDLGLMPKPLKDRFKFIAEFEPYTLDELSEIVEHVSKHYGFTLNKSICQLVAKTCRGNPRHTVSRTEFIRDFMVANDLKSISKNELLEVIQLQGFDEEGYRDIDHQYLSIVEEFGPISLKSISAKMGVDELTLKEDVENYLIQKDKVEITTKGRVIDE